VDWDVVGATALEHAGKVFRLDHVGKGVLVNDGENHLELGACAVADDAALTVMLTPGTQTYYEARARQGEPFSKSDLVAATIVAAIAGHPDAEEDRVGTQLSAVWTHHLAIVAGDDPRRVTTTYAPTETKRISWRIQHIAALGVRVLYSASE
jgi:hypothetical protein